MSSIWMTTDHAGGLGRESRSVEPPRTARPPGYAADLGVMHRLMTEGPAQPRGGDAAGEPEGQVPRGVYAALRAEARGQGELP